LAGFIRALGAGPVHVVGWSYGASVGLAMVEALRGLQRTVTVEKVLPSARRGHEDHRQPVQHLQRRLQAGDHADLGRVVAPDLVRIDVDVDQLRGGKLNVYSPQLFRGVGEDDAATGVDHRVARAHERADDALGGGIVHRGLLQAARVHRLALE
jgi:pimeloyl-ACP methyl ester carboxylesterase